MVKKKEELNMSFVPEEHYRNRSRFPAAELASFYGKEVAWSLDGTRIIASGDDPRQVCAAVQQSGLKSDEVVLAYIPFPEELIMGAAFLPDQGDDA
jgi:hypothetical protein